MQAARIAAPQYHRDDCRPDLANPAQIQVWNNFEYLSATGQPWQEALEAKAAGINRTLSS